MPSPEVAPPEEVAEPAAVEEVVAQVEAPPAEEAAEVAPAEAAPEAPAAEEAGAAEESPAEEASPAGGAGGGGTGGGGKETGGGESETGEESSITDAPEEVASATTEEDLVESTESESERGKKEVAARKEVAPVSPKEVAETEVAPGPPAMLPRIQVHTKIPIELARELEGARTQVNVQMQTSNTILTQILSEFQTGTQKRQLMMSIKLHSDVNDEEEDEDEFDIEVRVELFESLAVIIARLVE